MMGTAPWARAPARSRGIWKPGSPPRSSAARSPQTHPTDRLADRRTPDRRPRAGNRLDGAVLFRSRSDAKCKGHSLEWTVSGVGRLDPEDRVVGRVG
jgi:hypothetical protein